MSSRSPAWGNVTLRPARCIFFDTCPTGAVTQWVKLSPAGARVAVHEGEFWAVSVNWICVTSRHTSEGARSIVYHAGSRRNTHRENEDKEKSWHAARTDRKRSNTIIHRAWTWPGDWAPKPTSMTTAAATCPQSFSLPSPLTASTNDY